MVSMNCQNYPNVNFKGAYPYSTKRALNKITKELDSSHTSYKVLEDKVVTGRDLGQYIKNAKAQMHDTVHNSLESFERGLQKAYREFKNTNKMV